MSIRDTFGVFANLGYSLASGSVKEKIDMDMVRFGKNKTENIRRQTKRLRRLMRNPVFRNVFYFRLKSDKSKAVKAVRLICMGLMHPCRSVQIKGDIGGGLFISHNFSVIHVSKAGINLRIGPGVVIGRNGESDFPIIGDNVYVASNATVIGHLTIGSNVIIGAGSVVVKDIPDNSVVVGNPGRVIRSLRKEDISLIVPEHEDTDSI